MKLLKKAGFSVAIVVALSTTAFAYLDPSVMAYAIQAVAGILVAVGAVAGLMWRRTKKKVNNALKIDENRKKDIEEDVVFFEEEKETEKTQK